MKTIWNSLFNFTSSFFRPGRAVYFESPRAPETTGAEESTGIIDKLEQSPDADFLKGVLSGWLEGHYPGITGKLPDDSFAWLLEGMAELGGWEDGMAKSGKSRAEIAQNLINTAFDYQYPNGKDQQAQGVLDRILVILKSPPSRRSDAQMRGGRLIEQAKERVSSPRLMELKEQLSGLQDTYDRYLVVANRAAIQMIKREWILRSLMEQQGFQYDRSGQAENYYYFTEDHSLVFESDSPKMTQEARDKINEANDSWRSMAQHYDRSNKTVERTEKAIERVEAQIRTEENLLNRS